MSLSRQIEIAKEANTIKFRELVSRLLYQITLHEARKGKGKSLSLIAESKELKDMTDKPVLVIGTGLGIDEKTYGPFRLMYEEEFVEALKLFSELSKLEDTGRTKDISPEEAFKQKLENIGNGTEARERKVKLLLEKMGLLGGILIGDEVYKLLDARRPGDRTILNFTYFGASSRHYGVTMLLAAPNRSQIDKRVRLQVDYYANCNTTCQSIMTPDGPLCITPGCPHITTTRYSNGRDISWKLKFWGPKYWPMYNTFNVLGFRDKMLKAT